MAARSQLRLNIITSLGATLVSTLVMAVAYPLYLHFLGYEQYGLWLVLSTVLTMAQVGNFGISPALVKLVAEDYGVGDVDGVYKYISVGMLSLLVSGAVLAGSVLALRESIVRLFGIRGADATLAYQLLPYVGALSVYLLMADAMNSVVAGLGRYDLVSYCQVAGQLLTVVTALVLFEFHYGVWSLLIANAVSSVFLNVTSLVLIRRITGSSCWLRLTWDRQRLRRMLNFGSWVFGGSIVNTAINPLNKLLITRYAGIAAVPIYDMAFAIAFKVRSFFESGFRSLAPEFSRLNALRPGEAQQRLLAADRQGTLAIVCWGTIVYGVVFLSCQWSLRLWLGTRFTASLPGIFQILLLGTYSGLWGLQAWYSLLGFGRSRHIFGSNVVQAGCNIGFVLLWPSPTLAIVAIGTSLGMFASTIYLRWHAVRLRRSLTVRPKTCLPSIGALPHRTDALHWIIEIVRPR
jgi:O-antigen/teichoic acid export membrane protein